MDSRLPLHQHTDMADHPPSELPRTYEDFITQLISAVPNTTGPAICPICHLNWLEGGEVVETPCNHKCHKACLTHWLASSQESRNLCPTCRSVLYTVDKDDWVRRTEALLRRALREFLLSHLPGADRQRQLQAQAFIDMIEPTIQHVREHVPHVWHFSDEAFEFCITSLIMECGHLFLPEWVELIRYCRDRISRRPMKDRTPDEAAYLRKQSSHFSLSLRTFLGRRWQDDISISIRRATPNERVLMGTRATRPWRRYRMPQYEHYVQPLLPVLDIGADFSTWIGAIHKGPREPWPSEPSKILKITETGIGSLASVAMNGWAVYAHHYDGETNVVSFDYKNLAPS